MVPHVFICFFYLKELCRVCQHVFCRLYLSNNLSRYCKSINNRKYPLELLKKTSKYTFMLTVCVFVQLATVQKSMLAACLQWSCFLYCVLLARVCPKHGFYCKFCIYNITVKSVILSSDTLVWKKFHGLLNIQEWSTFKHLPQAAKGRCKRGYVGRNV